MSVSALASRYDYPADTTNSSQASPRSPTAPGRVNSPEASRLSAPQPGTYNLNERAPSPLSEEINRRKQRLQELEELELREQEYELRLKERDIEQRSRQLEQDRLRLRSARGMGVDTGYDSDGSRNDRNNKLLLPVAAMTESPGASPVMQAARHPYASSSTQLPSPGQMQRPHAVQRYASQQSLVQAHASPTTPTPRSQISMVHPLPPPSPRERDRRDSTGGRPTLALAPLTMRPDHDHGGKHDNKTKGWIRRLSMPVMGSFSSSSDSKKAQGISNTSYTPTGAFRNSFVEEESPVEMGSKHRGMGMGHLGRR